MSARSPVTLLTSALARSFPTVLFWAWGMRDVAWATSVSDAAAIAKATSEQPSDWHLEANRPLLPLWCSFQTGGDAKLRDVAHEVAGCSIP